MTRFATLALAALVPTAWLLSTGIGTTDHQPVKGEAKAVAQKVHMPTKAICVMTPLSGSKVHGVIVFTQKGHTVHVKGKITGLTPGLHGFHVHEYGDLTDDKGMSTGGHFDPDKTKHGGPDSKERHVGDLGNVKANDKGVAEIDLMDKMLSLSGPHSIIGRGLIVHAKADDLKSQPAGDAGGRVGGGVIGVAKDEEAKKH
ncbi:MAG: superoxide dismutase family protein [Gemmataceae bacterium]|nr:superoxide dismutase family protein [Gemmataceae bacterium]